MTAKVPPCGKSAQLDRRPLPPCRRGRCRRSARRCWCRPWRRRARLSSAPAAPRRSGANGCGMSAAAVERASAGASMRAAKLFAVLAVGTITTGRLLALGLGDDAIDHAHALVPAGGGRPAVVDDDGDGAGAFERGFARRDSAPARPAQRSAARRRAGAAASATTARRPASSPGSRDRRGCASAGR